MPNPSIEFIKPTSRSLGRMTTILFRPFDMGKWFVLGFTAWLATLMDGGGSSAGNVPSGDFGESDQSKGFEEIIQPARTFIEENATWLIPLVAVFVLLILAFSLVYLWLSSRGKFMFLDNVVHNRALVKDPWSQFRMAGNSLFWWRLIFGLAVFVAMVGLIGGAGYYLYTTFNAENISPTWISVIVISSLVFILCIIAMTYVAMLLEDFVIPMMYRDALGVMAAWRRFLALHNRNIGQFVIYFFWKALLGMAAGLIMITVILITCCIAACFLAIPYIGAVLLLPVTVFYRAIGPEFLRQFGDEYDLWYGSEDNYGFAPRSLP